MSIAIKVIKILLMIGVWGFLTTCSQDILYVSSGNFYHVGELSVKVINVPATRAPVAMDIYVPQASFRYPVVIFQHGFTASIKAYETIMAHLASHGFVVVVPQMYPPGDFYHAPSPEEEAALGGEVIAWLEDSIKMTVPVNADMSLLGLCGHSRGGQIAYRMALHIADKVKALAGVDPVDALAIFGQTPVVSGPFSFDIPTYILGTGLGPVVVDDFLACAPEEIGPRHFYEANPPPSWLVTAIENGHADMIDEDDYVPFCPGGPDRDGMRALTAGSLAAFLSGTLQNNPCALAVLTDPTTMPVPAVAEYK